MKNPIRFPALAMFFILYCGVTALAQDTGGTLQYGPANDGGLTAISPTAVPTLGGTGLVLLSALFLTLFWRMHRRGDVQHTRIMAVALTSGALASGIGGVKLVSDAIAQTGDFWDMTNPAGGTLNVGTQPGILGCVRNTTDINMVVLAMEGTLFGTPVSIDTGCEMDGSPAPHDNPGCEVGMVLPPTKVCGVYTGNAGNASDIRLKTDITVVGAHENGLPLYEFRYIEGTTRYRGVMAQDVMNHTPEAVLVMPNGYLAVDYELIGMEMSEVQ